MTSLNLPVAEPTCQLLFDVPDTKLGNILQESLDLSRRHPRILCLVEADLEAAARESKKTRLLEKRFQAEMTPSLPIDDLPPAAELNAQDLALGVGRRRMPAEVVYLFISVRGYLSSVTDQVAAEIIRDSTTVRRYFAERGLCVPAARTILDNLSHVSQATRDAIIDCQMDAVLEDGLDDFKKMTVDSTAVKGNNRWPVDSALLHDHLRRVFLTGKKLDRFGLPAFRDWHVPGWLKKLHSLDFQASACGGKPGSRKARKKLYRKIRATAEKTVARMEKELALVRESYDPDAFSPLVRERLNRLFQNMEGDLQNVRTICEYNRKRMEEEISVPSIEKILTMADSDAAIIVKGDRDPTLGYKPQVIRTGNGFIPGMMIEQGNISDSGSLQKLTELHRERTGVLPESVSADDGYASKNNRNKLLEKGVEKISFSGSKGRKIIPDEQWDTPEFLELRNDRSAVESIIFTLKYVFGFDRARRRGLTAVKEELTEKIIAHNFWRMALLRKRALATAA